MPPGKYRRRARHVREHIAEHAAGAAVGHGDGLLLPEQELGRAGLDIRRVNAVGEGAELALHAREAGAIMASASASVGAFAVMRTRHSPSLA